MSFQVLEAATGDASAFRLVPNPRFLWNFALSPPHFQPGEGGISNWFTGLVLGYAKQTCLISCGMPVSIMLLARKSRFFAGTRFLKRGTNLDGNVANEVSLVACAIETPQGYRIHAR